MIKTSDHELDGVAHCSPSKYPDQDWLHLAGTQHSSEATLTDPAARAAALWKRHDCNSPTRQNKQPEHKSAAPPTAINQTEQGEDNIWFQESLLGGQQLKPEQCGGRGGCQGQSEPFVLEGTDHVASAAVPITELSA